MPPKPVQVEEFDDDTDFALPTVPSSGGAGGPTAMPSIPGMPELTSAQMEEFQRMMASQMGGAGMGMGMGMGGGSAAAGPAAAPIPFGAYGMPSKPSSSTPQEVKAWTTLWPIYFDAKRPFKKGCRRVAYERSSPWPIAVAIQAAARELGLQTFHEPYKTHPQDWKNPGRVKVRLYAAEGRTPLVKSVPNKMTLLSLVAQRMQPHCGGKPPPLPSPRRKSKRSGGGDDGDGSGDGDAKAESKKRSSDALAAKGSRDSGATSAEQAPQQQAKQKRKKKRRAGVASSGEAMMRSRLWRIERSKSVPRDQRLPPHSRALAHGLLNTDVGAMMKQALPAMGGGGAAGAGAGVGGGGMGNLGAMMGSLGLGDDDDDDDEGGEAEAERKRQEEEEERKRRDPLAGLGRRGRKKVIRVGR